MSMEEIAVYVNQKLKEGYSIAKVERKLNYGKDTLRKKLNYGKDTLRKKLNRDGYKYDKVLKEFILDDNTNITQDITHTENSIDDKQKSDTNKINSNVRYTEKNVITNSVTHDITHHEIGTNNDSEIKGKVTQNITYAEKPHVIQTDNTPKTFTDEDFNILFEIINTYKSKGDIKEKNITIPRDDSDITTRSFRSYKNVFDSFSEYCKSNQLNQKDAIADALISYISK